TGTYYAPRHDAFASDTDFRNAILASPAMPIVWEPVPEIRMREGVLNGRVTQAVDGGIRNVSPLGDVIEEINKAGSDDYTIVIINCNPGVLVEESFREAHIAQIALRSLVEI